MTVARDLLQNNLNRLASGFQAPRQAHLPSEAQVEGPKEAHHRIFLLRQQYSLVYAALGAQARDEWTRKNWLQL